MAGPTTTTTTLKGSIWTGYAGDTVGLPALRLPYKSPSLPSPRRRNHSLRHQRARHTSWGRSSGLSLVVHWYVTHVTLGVWPAGLVLIPIVCSLQIPDHTQYLDMLLPKPCAHAHAVVLVPIISLCFLVERKGTSTGTASWRRVQSMCLDACRSCAWRSYPCLWSSQWTDDSRGGDEDRGCDA